jgi:pilus assembly protein CpaF
MSGAMDKLTARQNAQRRAGSSKVEGFEASVHRIKEQVLPACSNASDPEAAATLNKDELAEEFRPIISEVLTELKINLTGASSSRWKRCWSTNCSASGRSRNCSPTRRSATSWSTAPIMLRRAQGQAELAKIQFRDEEHLFQIAQRIVNKVGRRVDQTTPLADARLRTAAASTSSFRRSAARHRHLHS